MPSFRNTALLAAATALVSVANADYIIDPDTVSEQDRAFWCQNQIASCPLICNQVADGKPLVNSCDPDTLQYGCLCADNTQPNISEYTLTIPYFTCTEYGNQCVNNCGGNPECQNSCRVDNPCGAQNPQLVNETESTSTASSTASATSTEDSENAINTNVLGADDDDSDDDGESAAITLGRSYGLAAVAGTLFAGFMAL